MFMPRHHCLIKRLYEYGCIDEHSCCRTASDNQVQSFRRAMDVTTEMRVELCVPPGLSGGAEVEFVVFDTLQRCHVPDGLCEGESFQVICDIDISEASCGGYCTKSAAWRMYNADELRCPRPEEGAAFYRGQHIEMRRSSGKMSSGVVLDILHAFETIYRCRIGDHSQTLEKHCTAADIASQEGEEFMQLARVCDMQVKAGRLAYLCEHVPDGWGFPAQA